MPTEQEINRAKEYLVLRLRAERLAVSTLNDALLSAARRIAGIARYYNVPPERFRFSANPSLQKEVNEVLELLRDALYSRIEGIDTFEDEDEEGQFVAPALTEKVNGKTFRQRLSEYVSRWGYEIEARKRRARSTSSGTGRRSWTASANTWTAPTITPG